MRNSRTKLMCPSLLSLLVRVLLLAPRDCTTRPKRRTGVQHTSCRSLVSTPEAGLSRPPGFFWNMPPKHSSAKQIGNTPPKHEQRDCPCLPRAPQRVGVWVRPGPTCKVKIERKRHPRTCCILVLHLRVAQFDGLPWL